MKGPLDSRQLLSFVILARTGSFTRTARELFLTQSAVSHAMKALEADVGCRLLDRVGKKVMLTQAGEQLLKHAEVILREMQTAREGLEHLGKWGRGRLRVGATSSICAALLPGVLREFKESFPQCLIQIEPGDSLELILALERQRIDLAVTLLTSDDGRLDSVPLFTDELVFIASPLHPWALAGEVSRSEISRQSVIVYRKTSQTFRLLDGYFRKEEVVLNTVIELGSMEAIKELVKLNLGISVMSPWLVEKELRDGSLVALPFGRRKLKRNWVIQYWRGRRLTLAEETFIGLCQTASRDLLPSIPTSGETEAAMPVGALVDRSH
jgi:LysR family transcriptional regulator, low CO2-responsive transcriptional regulator